MKWRKIIYLVASGRNSAEIRQDWVVYKSLDCERWKMNHIRKSLEKFLYETGAKQSSVLCLMGLDRKSCIVSCSLAKRSIQTSSVNNQQYYKKSLRNIVVVLQRQSTHICSHVAKTEGTRAENFNGHAGRLESCIIRLSYVSVLRIGSLNDTNF